MTLHLSRLAGTLPDRLVAEACGVSRSTVVLYRAARDIPPAGVHARSLAHEAATRDALARDPHITAAALATVLDVHERTARVYLRRERGPQPKRHRKPQPIDARAIAWLAEEFEPVRTAQVAEALGLSMAAVRVVLDRIGATSYRDHRNHLVWVGP